MGKGDNSSSKERRNHFSPLEQLGKITTTEISPTDARSHNPDEPPPLSPLSTLLLPLKSLPSPSGSQRLASTEITTQRKALTV